MELAQLIDEPKHKPKQVAHWLNMLANFQVELGADMATVRVTLGKIVESFPKSPGGRTGATRRAWRAWKMSSTDCASRSA